MANIIKYTTQSLSATLAGLANGNHATSYTFGFGDAGIVWGDSTQYKEVHKLTYTAQLPTYLTPSTTGGSVSSSTYTVYAYATFESTGLNSNIAQQIVEIRQHAIPEITSVPKTALWVGDSVEISYTFAYTPFNTDTKFSSTNDTGVLSCTQSDNKYNIVASAVSSSNISHGTASVKATAQDPVGHVSDSVSIDTFVPVSNVVFKINDSYYSSASTQPSHQITVMQGADVFISAYYEGTYNSETGPTKCLAYNSYFSGVEINSDAKTLTTYSYGEESTVVSDSATGSYTVDLNLSNSITGSGFEFKKVKGASTIKIETTTGTPTTATLGAPNALSTLINFITIAVVTNFEITLSMTEINPGDKTTVTFSGGVGNAKSVELVNSDQEGAEVLATFDAGAGKSLVDGTFEAVIPSSIADGSWFIRVTPENGAPQHEPIRVKHVTLTLS